MNINNQAHEVRYRQKPKDRYYTPLKLAKELISKVPLKPEDIVLDPCMGKGAFYNQYPEGIKKDWCEIDDGRDYFNSSAYENQVDWVITNPPYSDLNRWIKKFTYSCRKGFALLLAEHAITPKRLKYIQEMGYGMTSIFYVKIMQWYGMSVFCVFEKGHKHIIDYTTIIYQAKSEERGSR